MTLQPEQPPPTLRLTIAEEALANNWRALDQLSGKAKAGAAIKANCYGLGIDTCLPVLRDAGAEQFFVAHWSEVGAAIRHVPGNSISVLHGPLTQEDAAYARATGAVPVINSISQAMLWNESGGGVCDVMVDTGINRLGISPDQLAETDIGALNVRVLMSHLACADEDTSMNAQQLRAFTSAAGELDHQMLSLANSAGIALGQDYAFDLTRPGLSLYGGIARAELSDVIAQVAFVEAAIIQVRTVEAGDSIGYNAQFTANDTMRIGTVSLGYADGFLRAWGNVDGRSGSHLRHGDKALPILGKVSMDMIVVDLSSAPDLREGDWLSVPYSLPDAAQQTSLSQYELLTVLGHRLRW